MKKERMEIEGQTRGSKNMTVLFNCLQNMDGKKQTTQYFFFVFLWGSFQNRGRLSSVLLFMKPGLKYQLKCITIIDINVVF